MKFFKWFLMAWFVAAIALPAAALNEWTVMLYFVSDDNESKAMIESHMKSLNGLAPAAGIAGKYAVTMLVDAPKGYSVWSKADKPDGGFVLEPGSDRKWNIAQALGEVNMGSPYTLWKFIKWTMEKHPARKYAVFLAGHGSGIFSWRGTGGVNSSNPGAVDFDPDKFVAYDDTDDDCLTVFEVQAVLEAVSAKMTGGRPIDVLVLDSCMPGAIEALYQLRDACRILVSSPSTTLIGGMPYIQIIKDLASNPAANDEEFGKMVAKNYIDRVVSMSNDGEAMGVFKPAESKALVGAMDQLSIELLRAQNEGKLSFKNLTTFGGKKRYWDLARLLRSMAGDGAEFGGVSNPERIRALAGEAGEALKASRVTTWYSGSFADQKIGGLSIAWPDKEEYAKWRSFYKALEFARQSHWDEFLEAWYQRK